MRTSKIYKLIIILVMIFQTITFNCSLSYAETNDPLNIEKYPKNDTVNYNGKVIYEDNIVGDFTVNGKQAFCMQHPLVTPNTGTNLTSSIYQNNDIKKVLYYGWGGPAQWSGFKNREHGIVVTSLTLSYFYYGDNSSPKTIESFLNYIKGKTISNYSVTFSKETISAYKEENIQRTESITLRSDMDIFGVTVKLQDNVTFVDETHGKKQTGGTITIKGKTKFHLEAPLNLKLETWSTGSKISRYEYMPIVSVPSGNNYQTLGNGKFVYDPSQTTSLTVNWLQLANLELTKTDIYGNLIDGAVFRLWNNEGYDQNVTVRNGKITVENLTTGIYYLQEKSAPQGFLLDDTIYTITLNPGDIGKQTVSNKEPTGRITITKENDNKDGIIGAKFNVIADGKITSAGGRVLYNNGDIVETLTTNSQGIAVTKNLPLGNYIVVETQAPAGYLLNSEKYKVSLKYANQTTPLITGSTTIQNKEPTGDILLKKAIDSSITDHQIGDSFLSQVEFGLYAKEVITNVAKTKVFYQKDELISKKVTDEKGEIQWKDLPMGKYYIKELNTNPSMILNPNVIDVTLSYKDQSTAKVTVQGQMQNTIASQRIQIFKEGIKEGEAGVIPGLEGAEFTFVLNSDYEKLGFDKAHKYFVGSTDKNGYLTTPLLPYGTYRVKETKTPEGYYGASDFLITIEKDASLYEIGYRIKKVTVNNVPFESLLKVVKKDQDTGKTVAIKGATFKVKNLDDNQYISYIDWAAFPNIFVDQWTTHEDGSITLNTKLKVGRYQLEEIEAPDGYLLQKDPVVFEITEDHYDISIDNVTPITIVDLVDKSVKGRVTLTKTGEVLSDYQDGEFIYEEKGLANAKFAIYAKNDILDPSHDGIILYSQGELVETLVTKADGKVISSELPLGDYECKELEAPNGYVLDTEVKTFSLIYQDQFTEIVFEELEIMDERQKIQIEVLKKDAETQKGLAGAEFTLTANRDIYNFDGQVIVEAGTILEKAISDIDGQVAFQKDLPLDLTPEYAIMPINDEIELIGDTNALYMLQESKQPDGYLSHKAHYYIDGQYTNQHEKVVYHQFEVSNQPTKTMIHKVDASSLMGIEGAKLQLIDSQTNQIIDEWISTKEGHLITGLTIEKNYIIHEVEAPSGYQLAKDMEFNIHDQEGEQSIIFMNEKTPVITLGDEPPVEEIIEKTEEIVETNDMTIILTYLLMGIGAIAIMTVLFKKEDEKK